MLDEATEGGSSEPGNDIRKSIDTYCAIQHLLASVKIELSSKKKITGRIFFYKNEKYILMLKLVIIFRKKRK